MPEEFAVKIVAISNSDISPRSKGRGKGTVVAIRKISFRWRSFLLSFSYFKKLNMELVETCLLLSSFGLMMTSS